MKKVIKLTMPEVNNIIAHYLIEHGRLENKATKLDWYHAFDLKHMTVELSQED